MDLIKSTRCSLSFYRQKKPKLIGLYIYKMPNSSVFSAIELAVINGVKNLAAVNGSASIICYYKFFDWFSFRRITVYKPRCFNNMNIKYGEIVQIINKGCFAV